MVAACYANPNWDGKDNADKREEYLRKLNEHFNQAITSVYHPEGVKEPDIDWDNPFFAAHKREMARTKKLFAEALRAEGKTAGDLLEAEQSSNGRGEDLDQIPRNN